MVRMLTPTIVVTRKRNQLVRNIGTPRHPIVVLQVLIEAVVAVGDTAVTLATIAMHGAVTMLVSTST